jgi:hypothetical protein
VSVARLDASTIVLSGDCPIKDAETLLGLLMSATGQTVDWRGCEGLHAALVQILLAAGPRMVGPPRDSFLRTMIAPSLDNGRKAEF